MDHLYSTSLSYFKEFEETFYQLFNELNEVHNEVKLNLKTEIDRML